MQTHRMPPMNQDMREFFKGMTAQEVTQKMDIRKEQIEQAGGTVVARRTKIGRNESCPCGSGRKFKKCCLPLAQ